MFDPKVDVMGIVSRISVGTHTALSTKLHRMTNEFTGLPCGTSVDKKDWATVPPTVPNVPVANPMIFPNAAREMVTVGTTAAVQNPCHAAPRVEATGTLQPDGSTIGTTLSSSWIAYFDSLYKNVT